MSLLCDQHTQFSSPKKAPLTVGFEPTFNRWPDGTHYHSAKGEAWGIYSSNPIEYAVVIDLGDAYDWHHNISTHDHMKVSRWLGSKVEGKGDL